MKNDRMGMDHKTGTSFREQIPGDTGATQVLWAYRSDDPDFINRLSDEPGDTVQLIYFGEVQPGCALEFERLREFVLNDHLFVVPPGVRFRITPFPDSKIDCVLIRVKPVPGDWFSRFGDPTKLRVRIDGYFKRLIEITAEFAQLGRVQTPLIPLLSQITAAAPEVEITLANHAEGFPPHYVPRHLHVQEYQVDYYVKARGRFLIDGLWEEIADGDVFYIPPGHEHAIEYEPDHEYHNLSLKWISREDDGTYSQGPIHARIRPDEVDLRGIFQRIVGSYLLSEPIAARDIALIVKLVTDANEKSGRPDGKAAVIRAKTIIENNYAMPLELPWVAARVDLSPSYLSRVFRRETGTTFANYVRSVRLARSHQLLTESNHPISDIAKMCGFGSLQYFSQAFKNQYGFSPRGMRVAKAPTVPADRSQW